MPLPLRLSVTSNKITIYALRSMLYTFLCAMCDVRCGSRDLAAIGPLRPFARSRGCCSAYPRFAFTFAFVFVRSFVCLFCPDTTCFAPPCSSLLTLFLHSSTDPTRHKATRRDHSIRFGPVRSGSVRFAKMSWDEMRWVFCCARLFV